MATPTTSLRPAVLAGVTVIRSGAPSPFGDHAAETAATLGATVQNLGLEAQPLDEENAARRAAEIATPHVLLIDAAGDFASPCDTDARSPDPLAPLRAATDRAWVAIRAVANEHWIPESPDGGRVVILSPPPRSGPHAAATRDALENLSRTLSIEWARFGIRIVTVAPGAATTADEVAGVVAFLASPAGEYYSGCLMTLGAA